MRPLPGLGWAGLAKAALSVGCHEQKLVKTSGYMMYCVCDLFDGNWPAAAAAAAAEHILHTERARKWARDVKNNKDKSNTPKVFARKQTKKQWKEQSHFLSESNWQWVCEAWRG